jgi:hypothetical protein
MRSASCLRAVSLLRAQLARSQVAHFASRAPPIAGGQNGRIADVRRSSTPALPSIDFRSSSSSSSASPTNNRFPPPGSDSSLALDFVVGRLRIVASSGAVAASVDERLSELRSLLAYSVQRSLPLTLIQRIFATIVENVAASGAAFVGNDVAHVMSALQSAKQSQAVLLLFQQATAVHRVAADDPAWPRLIEFALRAAAIRIQPRLVLLFLRRYLPWSKPRSSGIAQIEPSHSLAADTVSTIIAMLQTVASTHSPSAPLHSSENVDAFIATHLDSTHSHSHPHRDIAAIIDLLCRVGVALPPSLLTPIVRVSLMINQPGLCRRVLAMPATIAYADAKMVDALIETSAAPSAAADFVPRHRMSSDTALSLLMSLSRDGELRAASLWFEMLMASTLASASASSFSSTLALLPALASEQAAQASLMLLAGFSSAAGPVVASSSPLPPLLESAWRLIERTSLPIALQPIVLEAAFSAAARTGARTVAVRVLGVMHRLASAANADADHGESMPPHTDALDELLLPILNRAAWLEDCPDSDSSIAGAANTDLAYVRSVLASLERLASVMGGARWRATSDADFRGDVTVHSTEAKLFSHWCSDELRIALRRHGLL